MKLGYYAQAPFIKSKGEYYIPFDYAIWAEEFPKQVEEFHFVLNHQQTDKVPGSYSKLPSNCRLHDLGPLQPHWKRALGLGLSAPQLQEITKGLDAFMVQGPTPLQLHLVKHAHPNCVVAPLLVGMWQEWPDVMFRVFPKHREWLINGLKKLNRWQTSRLLNHYEVFFMGNNPLNPAYYRCSKPFHLVSKGLVKENELTATPTLPERPVKNLVFFSRLEPEKYVELLIRAMAVIGIKYDVTLQVYGDNNTPSYLAFLTELASELKVNDKVRFNGGVPFHQKQRVFSEADIYIFNTCSTEGFPRTIWEGIAHGIPVLSVAYPGAREFFEDGKHLVLFEQNKVDSLVAQLERLINDQALRRKIVEGGHELLRQHTTEKSVAHIASLLSQAVEKRKNRK